MKAVRTIVDESLKKSFGSPKAVKAVGNFKQAKAGTFTSIEGVLCRVRKSHGGCACGNETGYARCIVFHHENCTTLRLEGKRPACCAEDRVGNDNVWFEKVKTKKK